jgi:hypothetical protein
MAVAFIAVITACVLLTTHRAPQPQHLSLVFEKYSSYLDFWDQPMAFLWLSNSSSKTYLLPMTGGTNTFVQGGSIEIDRDFSGSYMILCELSDQTNRAPQLSVTNWGQSVGLGPHSAIRVRVPLPPNTQKKRVAVFCAEEPRVIMLLKYKIGWTVFRMLPLSLQKKLLLPERFRVWCDQELMPPSEGFPW